MAKTCRGYAGMWEARTIFNTQLAREFFGYDGSAIILLHGYVKATGDEASIPDFAKANGYWRDYQVHHNVSAEAGGDE